MKKENNIDISALLTSLLLNKCVLCLRDITSYRDFDSNKSLHSLTIGNIIQIKNMCENDNEHFTKFYGKTHKTVLIGPIGEVIDIKGDKVLIKSLVKHTIPGKRKLFTTLFNGMYIQDSSNLSIHSWTPKIWVNISNIERIKHSTDRNCVFIDKYFGRHLHLKYPTIDNYQINNLFKEFEKEYSRWIYLHKS